MTFVGWVVFGLITGFVASGVVNQQGQGCILNVVLGILGACVGGLIFTSIGGRGITGFNVYSMFVAVVGAIVVLVVYHAITGRRRFPLAQARPFRDGTLGGSAGFRLATKERGTAMTARAIEKAEWAAFCAAVSKALEGS